MQEFSISVRAPFPKDFQQNLFHVIRPHFPSKVDYCDNCVHLEFSDVMDYFGFLLCCIFFVDLFGRTWL